MGTQTFLDKLLGKAVAYLGVAQPPQGTINFTGAGVTVTDDPTNGATVVDIAAGGAGAPLTAASTFSAGQVFRGTTAGHALLATASLTSVPFSGVATAGILSGNPGQFQTSGVLSPSIKNLGAGIACAVGVDSSGTPVRANDLTCRSAPNWIGFCDTNGVITLGARLETKFVVTDYGCVGDGTTPNAVALQWLIDHALPLNVGNSIDLYFPAGQYALEDDIHLTRVVNMWGSGTASESSQVQLLFAIGKKLIVENATTTYISGGAADFSDIHHLDLIFTPLTPSSTPSMVDWPAHTVVAVGRFVRDDDQCRYYYECVKGGTTNNVAGGTKPNFRDTCYRPYYGMTWAQAKAKYPSGPFAPGLTIHNTTSSGVVYFQCTTAGVWGASEPSWDVTIGHTTPESTGAAVWTTRDASSIFSIPSDDNGVIWACRTAPGIDARATCDIHHNRIFTSTNGGVHVYANAVSDQPPVGASSGNIYNNRIVQCGGGVDIRGTDANQWNIYQNKVSACGTHWVNNDRTHSTHGHGTFGIWDGSFLGCNIRENLVEGNGGIPTGASSGPAYITGYQDITIFYGSAYAGYPDRIEGATPNATGGSITENYAEADTYPNIAGGGGCTIWGSASMGSGYSLSSVGAASGYAGNCFRRLYTQNDTGPKQITTQFGVEGSNIGARFGSVIDDTSNLVQFEYQQGAMGRTGWWTWSYGAGFVGPSISSTTAAEGAGWWWEPEGQFRGLTAHQYFVGYDVAALVDARVRSTGQWNVGDRTDLVGTGVAGTWNGQVVKTAGNRGNGWIHTAYTAGSPTQGIPASVIRGTANATGFAFKCTTSGTSSGTEPTWDTVTGHNTTDPGGVVWQCLGPVPTYNNLGFIDDPVVAITPQTLLAWQDTAGTDAATAAPKCYVLSYRFQTATTTSAANQTLFAIPDDFPDNATCLVSVQVEGKRNGNHASYTIGTITGYRGRNNAGAPEDGVDVSTGSSWGSENSLTGMSYDLHDTSNHALVRINNPPAYQVDWGIQVQISVRAS